MVHGETDRRVRREDPRSQGGGRDVALARVPGHSRPACWRFSRPGYSSSVGPTTRMDGSSSRAGAEVVEGGIPRENPWADVSGLGVVVQQWLHDLWAWAWYRALGFAGLDAMAVVEACLIVAVAWRCLPAFREGARPGAAAVSLGCAAAVFAIGPYLGVRPTAWTMLATLAACGICRKARGDCRLYALLPALTALHVNLHAAMWPLPGIRRRVLPPSGPLGHGLDSRWAAARRMGQVPGAPRRGGGGHGRGVLAQSVRSAGGPFTASPARARRPTVDTSAR